MSAAKIALASATQISYFEKIFLQRLLKINKPGVRDQ